MIDDKTLLTLGGIAANVVILLAKMHYDSVVASNQRREAAEQVKRAAEELADQNAQAAAALAHTAREAAVKLADDVKAKSDALAEELHNVDVKRDIRFKAMFLQLDRQDRTLESQNKTMEQQGQVLLETKELARSGNDIKSDLVRVGETVAKNQETILEIKSKTKESSP